MEMTLTFPNISQANLGFFGSFAMAAARFESDVSLQYRGKTVDAKSILALMSIEIPLGDDFILRAEGTDAAEALEQLSAQFKAIRVMQ